MLSSPAQYEEAEAGDLSSPRRARDRGLALRRDAMAASVEPQVRTARPDDAAAICGFGEAHIRPHYAPLIGAAAADEQVHRWWSEAQIDAAVSAGLVVVAEVDGQV